MQASACLCTVGGGNASICLCMYSRRGECKYLLVYVQ